MPEVETASEVMTKHRPSRALFLLLLIVYVLFPDLMTQTPILVIGGAKVYLGDMFFFLSAFGIASAFISGRRPRVRNNTVMILFVSMIIYGIFQSLRGISAYGYSAFGEHARSEYYIVLLGLFAYAVYPNVREIARLLKSLYAIGVVAALVTIAGFLLFIAEPKGADVGWIRFSNSLTSLFMVFSLIYVVNKTLMSGSARIGEGFAGMLLVIGLLFGQARTDWVAGAVGIAVVIWVHRERTKRLLVLGAIALVTAVAVFWGIKYLIPGSITYSLARSTTFLQGLGEDPDWVWRVRIWQEVFRQSMATPFLGKGLGTPYEFTAFGINYFNLQPHDGWLMLLYDQGIVGVLLNLGAFIAASYYMLKLIRVSKHDQAVTFVASTLLGLIAAQFVYFIPYWSTLFTWVVPGLAVVLWRERYRFAAHYAVISRGKNRSTSMKSSLHFGQ